MQIEERPRVLLITQYYPPDLVAASFRMKDMVLSLEDCGCEVTVITSFPHRVVVDGEINSDNEKNILRIRVPKAGKSFLSRINNYTYFALNSALKAVFGTRGKYDVVIVSSPPLFLAFTGYVVSRIKRAKYIADIRDIWPDSAVAASMLKEGSFLHKLFLRMEKFFYRSAHHVICVSRLMKKHIAGFKNKKDISVVYNGFSQDVATEEMHEAGDKKTLTIAYVGNLGMLQGLDILIQAVSIVQEVEAGYTLRLRFIGDGVQRQKLESRVRELGLKNVEFIGAVPREQLSRYLHDVHVLFLHLLDHPVLEKTIPSKLFDYLYYNKPILSGIRGEGKEIVENLGCGLVFEPENMGELINSLKLLQENYALYMKKSSNNRTYVENYFNRRENFRKTFKKILPMLEVGKNQQ